jgi:pyoverdine/dityrosine biosynthesis protein Dit1
MDCDKLQFTELLGVTDSTAYQYGAELRRMVSTFQLNHISLLRVRDLLSTDHSDLTEAEYLIDAPNTRQEFLLTDIGKYDAEAHVKSDEVVRRTYHGYMRSLIKLDLQDLGAQEGQTLENTDAHEAEQAYLSRKARKKILSAIAKRMMSNGAVRNILYVLRTFLKGDGLNC